MSIPAKLPAITLNLLDQMAKNHVQQFENSFYKIASGMMTSNLDRTLTEDFEADLQMVPANLRKPVVYLRKLRMRYMRICEHVGVRPDEVCLEMLDARIATAKSAIAKDFTPNFATYGIMGHGGAGGAGLSMPFSVSYTDITSVGDAHSKKV